VTESFVDSLLAGTIGYGIAWRCRKSGEGFSKLGVEDFAWVWPYQ